jgi:hypothetical protein
VVTIEKVIDLLIVELDILARHCELAIGLCLLHLLYFIEQGPNASRDDAFRWRLLLKCLFGDERDY